MQFSLKSDKKQAIYVNTFFPGLAGVCAFVSTSPTYCGLQWSSEEPLLDPVLSYVKMF